MNEKEKSAALTKLTGIGKYTGPPVSSFIKSWQGEIDVTTIDGTPFDYNAPNLYASENMALLADVLAWLGGVTHWEPDIGVWVKWMTFARDEMTILHLHEWMCNCADYGLQLAIEAGLVSEATVK